MDGSLNNKVIGPLKSIDMIAPAERFDLLIKFNRESQCDRVKLVHGNMETITTIFLKN